MSVSPKKRGGNWKNPPPKGLVRNEANHITSLGIGFID